MSVIAPIRLAGLPELQQRLRVEPAQAFNQWTIASQASDHSPRIPLARVTVTTDKPPTITAFYGKGGFTLILADQAAVLLALPGAFGHWRGVDFVMEGDSPILARPAVCPPVLAITPQTVTTQAMILGAGLATRFEPVSGDWTGVSKPGAPIVAHWTVIRLLVEHLAQFGITDIFINTFYKPEQLKASLIGEGLPRIHFIDEIQPSGTAGALRALLLGQVPSQVAAAFDPEQPLLVVQGDAVTDADMGALLTAHHQQQALVTLGCMHKGDEDVSKFGIVATDHADGRSGRIQTFLEKPSLEAAGPHRLANTGFYVFSPQAYPLIQQAAAGKHPGETVDFALDVFPQVMTNCNDLKITASKPGGFWAQEIAGYWSDIGNPAQYGQTVHDLYNGHVALPFGAMWATAQTDHQVAVQSTRQESPEGDLLALRYEATEVVIWPGVDLMGCEPQGITGPVIVAPAGQ
ncbi:MAG: nucleotidyltransferase family protein [Vampirovibrionales bacterium]